MPNAPEIIHIAVSCDDNYAPHLGVSLLSMLQNSSAPCRIVIHLIDAGVAPHNLEKLQVLVQRHHATLQVIPADTTAYEGLPVLRYSRAVYQRISLPDLLDSTINRVIYLDSDTVVLGDIVELWHTPLEGYPLAAVENLSPYAHQDIGLPRNAYFNSGVLILDLDYWRNNHLSDKILHFITEHSERLRFLDQCAMNSVIEGAWKRLTLSWNQQSDIYGVYKKHHPGCGYTVTSFIEAMQTPNIVHYLGKRKPWHINCYHPFKGFYKAYLKQSPWAGMQPTDNSWQAYLRNWLSIYRHIKRMRRQQDIKIARPS